MEHFEERAFISVFSRSGSLLRWDQVMLFARSAIFLLIMIFWIQLKSGAKSIMAQSLSKNILPNSFLGNIPKLFTQHSKSYLARSAELSSAA